MADDVKGKGPALLGAALKETSVRHLQLEEELDIARGLVSRWLKGDRTPGLREALFLERRFGIPAKAWLTEEAAARIDDAERATGTEG